MSERRHATPPVKEPFGYPVGAREEEEDVLFKMTGEGTAAQLVLWW